MNKAKKIEKLLKWVKQNYSTFQDRARESRIVLTADEHGLDMMLVAIE